MLKKLLYTIFTTTAILSWSLLAHANCPAVPTNGGTLKLTTGANCSYNASDFMGKNIIITGDGDISINGDIDFTSGSSLTISSPTANVTFEGIVKVSGGSITNNGIIELKKDFTQTGGTLTNNSLIKGENISFSVTGGGLNLNNGSAVLIDNKTATSKTITIKGNIGKDINFNTGSSFSASGSKVTLIATTDNQVINGEIRVLDADLYYNPSKNNETLTISKTGKLVVLDTNPPYNTGMIHYAKKWKQRHN